MVTDQPSPNSPTAPTAAAADSNGVVNGGLPSPWASVVRGDSEQITTTEHASVVDNSVIESSVPEAQQESSDVVVVDEETNGSRARRPVWNRPSNGVVEPVSVMGGAVSWPALSESTRPGPGQRSPATDGSASSSQAPIMIAQPPQRQANTTGHANSAANSTMPVRPRSRTRGGGGGGGSSGPSHGTVNRPSAPAPPPFPVVEVPYGLIPPPMMDTSVRGSRPAGGLDGSQLRTVNDHSSPRNASRRGSYGPRPRGDGPFNNNHGGRRNQERRDFHPPPQYIPPPMGYMPSPMPPGAGPFMAPPPVRMFPGQMGFDMPSPFIYFPTMPPESFRGMPIGPPPPPPMPFPAGNENPSTNAIVNQIDYYFSDDNLVKDTFLRSRMDDQGWVPITIIASFRRVQLLTPDISVILEALKHSTIVEVQGDRVRRRNEWMRWLQNSGSSSPNAAPEDHLTASFQDISINDPMTNANGNMEAVDGHTEMATGGYLAEGMNGQSRLGSGEDTAEEAHSISL